MSNKWGVWCRTSGGVTGLREAWLKLGGVRAEFDTRKAAEDQALACDPRTLSTGARLEYFAREIF